MNRRAFLQTTGVGVAAVLSGCSEYIHRARGVDTPVSFRIVNRRETTQSITVQIARDGADIFEGTSTLSGEGTVEEVTGDDFRETEFTEAGMYTITVSREEQETQSTVDVSWRDLTDCNTNSLVVAMRDDGPTVWMQRTTAGCGGLDALGS